MEDFDDNQDKQKVVENLEGFRGNSPGADATPKRHGAIGESSQGSYSEEKGDNAIDPDFGFAGIFIEMVAISVFDHSEEW